jgi:rhamnosyltransferase
MSNVADNYPPAGTVIYRPDPRLLDSLLGVLGRGGRRLFIFINGSVDPIVDRSLSLLANAKIIRSSENVGLGAGLNAVVGAASDEGFGHILLFDQDSTPGEKLAEALMNRFRSFDKPPRRLAAVGPLLVPPRDSGYLPIRYWRRSARKESLQGAVDFLPTSGSLVSIAAWHKVGPFRADYFIGGIDVEWGYRCWACGFASAVADDIQMAHRWGHEGRRGRGGCKQILREGDPRIYYYIRNAIDGLHLPHMPLRWKTRQIVVFVAQLSVLLASRHFAADCFRLISRAVRDGWTGRLGPAPNDLVARQ